MTPRPRTVHIHYHRLPDREDVYEQALVLDDPSVKVTYQPSTPIPRPVTVEGVPVLEPGSPAVWFTFPGVWHDIGRFHDGDGRFTGLYANILTPCKLHSHPPGSAPRRADATGGVLRWDTTDLFLDVWRGADGRLHLLDEEDLGRAEGEGTIPRELARAARREADRILAAAREGSWPPSVVEEWTLERVREALE